MKDCSLEKLMNGLVNDKSGRKDGNNGNDENLYLLLSFHRSNLLYYMEIFSLETRVFFIVTNR